MKITTKFVFIVVILFLAGCAKYQLIQGGSTVTVGKSFRVNPEIAWSQYKSGNVHIWTINGPALERLMFFPAIEDGEALLDIKPQAGSKEMPKFKSSMTLLDIVDLLEATFARLDTHQFEKQNLEPTPFGGQEGFRIEFSFVEDSGLQRRGVAAGAVKDDKLYMIIYAGAAIHYYEKHAATADHIINSVEIL